MIKRRSVPVLAAAFSIAASFLFFPGHARGDEYYDRKVSLFDSLPVFSEDIVFLGNSITDGAEFHELFGLPNIKNRGISSDVIEGVTRRLRQITSGQPAKIFLLIGINDVSHHLSVDQLARRYETLVDSIILQSPESRLYIQSMMPVNNTFGRYRNLIGKEQTIIDFNRKIAEIAEKRGLKYIDLFPALSDSEGRLRREFTNDGLHLNGPGYKAWTKAITEFVTE